MKQLRAHFPIFDRYPRLAYLDNAATTQKPSSVLKVMDTFMRYETANIHRGVYDLSFKATRRYEQARQKVADFLGAKKENIGFTTGTTGSINIVAQSYLRPKLSRNDNIVISLMEHHANFIPWQMLAKETGAELRIVPLDTHGDLDLDALSSLLDRNTRMLSVTHISNTLGTINDIAAITEIAHRKHIPVLIDAAQSAAFYDIDVTDLQYDFLAFSGHKIFGPFGTGVLYAGDPYIEEVRPYQTGGGIILDVSVEETMFKPYPYHLEAGTMNIPGVIGLAKALEFINGLDRTEVRKHIHVLGEKLREGLKNINEAQIIGDAKKRSGIVSFVIEGIHPHDLASFLNKDEIAVRAGMHCTQPLLDHLQAPSTVRVSFSLYNTDEEVDRLLDALKEIIKFWA